MTADSIEYSAGQPASRNNLSDDPEWYKRAVFYEVLVRTFFDSNGDGTGDIRGLIDKLDYLAWLGVDCLWIPPFYDSPLRDGGYDIRDYRKVLPEFGTVDDFAALITACHERGMRIITDLVMNHTSDSHQWFQESRRDPEGRYGDYYVWADDDAGYPDARVIFVDTEPSNWTFDPVRKQYFWHRFFSHQPDLNFDCPAVGDAMIDAMRFWLDLGIDVFRLDAVPYLYVREGTNGENLPQTHDFLKRVRKEVDALYPDRVLLCEANQWPQDVVEYFGDAEVGDECQMAFHFPLMPRLFMAVRRESRYPITEILAPLLENSRDQIELFTGLLLSLPGSPVLYYGDEIGMGDNIYLGDRDGVRTPMQWSPDRNGGFSKADPAQLYLPAIMDLVYGFATLNVEAQSRVQSSLFHWMRNLITIRNGTSFGRGTLTFLKPANRKVLAYMREHE